MVVFKGVMGLGAVLLFYLSHKGLPILPLGERLVCSLAGYLLFTAAILSTNVELLFLLSLGDIGEDG